MTMKYRFKKPPAVEDETLYHPSETDYRDMMADEVQCLDQLVPQKLPRRHALELSNMLANRQLEMEASGMKEWVFSSPNMGRSTTSSAPVLR